MGQINLDIDVAHLIEVIRQELKDVVGSCVEGKVVVGKVRGREIQLVVTSRSDDFLGDDEEEEEDADGPNTICITESPYSAARDGGA